jgi:hypothetical protein
MPDMRTRRLALARLIERNLPSKPTPNGEPSSLTPLSSLPSKPLRSNHALH